MDRVWIIACDSERAVPFTRAALDHTCIVFRAAPRPLFNTCIRVHSTLIGVLTFRELIDVASPERSACDRVHVCSELHAALPLSMAFHASGVVRHILECVAAPRIFVSVQDEMHAQKIILDADRRGYKFPPTLTARLRDTVAGSPYPVLQFLWRIATHAGDAGFPIYKLSFASLQSLGVPILRQAYRRAACILIQRRYRVFRSKLRKDVTCGWSKIRVEPQHDIQDTIYGTQSVTV